MLRIIDISRLLDEWKKAIMIIFFDQKEKKDVNNYRGINVPNTTRMIDFTKNQRIILQDEQQGSRTCISSSDAVFIIKQIKRKSLENNKPAYICLI